MVGPSMRPRFTVESPLSYHDILDRLRHRVSSDGDCAGVVLGKHVVIKPAQEETHYWSPQLSLEVNPTENGSELHGLFGPHPNVWTLFTAIYAAFGLTALIALLFGISQWSIGMYPMGLWFVPAALLCMLITYLIALAGQRISQNQMEKLRKVLTEALELDTAST